MDAVADTVQKNAASAATSRVPAAYSSMGLPSMPNSRSGLELLGFAQTFFYEMKRRNTDLTKWKKAKGDFCQ